MLWDIGIGVLSNFIFVVLAILIAWLYYLVSKRKKLLRFFGLEKSRRIVIYLSNLRVVESGAIGVNGKHRSYQGSASAFGELLAARELENLFNYFLPSMADKPAILNRLLISDIDVQTVISPLIKGELERAVPFIAFGTPAYNIASGFLESEMHSRVRFNLGVRPSGPRSRRGESIIDEVSDTASYTVVQSPAVLDEDLSHESGSATSLLPSQFNPPPSGVLIEDSLARMIERPSSIILDGVSPIIEATTGFVERIYDAERDRCLFYVAGLSELATACSAHFLASKWNDLYKKYGASKPFLVMLKVESTDYKKSSILFEK